MPPRLIYDDDCHYCTWAATFAVRRSDIEPVRLSHVEAGESTLTDTERSRLHDGYEECAQLITDDAVYSCGAAIEQALVHADVLPARHIEPLRRYAGYIGLREAIYHFMSNHRALWSKVLHRDPPIQR